MIKKWIDMEIKAILQGHSLRHELSSLPIIALTI